MDHLFFFLPFLPFDLVWFVALTLGEFVTELSLALASVVSA